MLPYSGKTINSSAQSVHALLFSNEKLETTQIYIFRLKLRCMKH